MSNLAEMLDAKIPRDAVSLREGGGKKKLSYLETWYVIDRMNKIFGHLNWSCETVELRLLSDTDKPTYLARVRIQVVTDSGRVVSKDGVGYGSDKNGMNPHEMAAKEAESDAFKRAAKNFGLSLGLALYAKDEDYIDDGTVANGVDSSVRGVAPVSEKPEAAKSIRPEKGAGKPVQVDAGTQPATREQINQLITEVSGVLVARRIKTLPELRQYMLQTFGVKTKEELTDEQAGAFHTYLKSIL